PHPFLVAEPKPPHPFLVAEPKPPHPFLVAEPKPPHPFLGAEPKRPLPHQQESRMKTRTRKWSRRRAALVAQRIIVLAASDALNSTRREHAAEIAKHQPEDAT